MRFKVWYTNEELDWMAIHAPIKLEYIIKKTEIEMQHNNMNSWMKFFEGISTPESRKMMWKLDALDEHYLPLIEKESMELFD